LQQQQKFIALAMATQGEILDACMNEKKKHKFHPKIRSRDSPKKKFKTGTKPSVARSSTEKKKTQNKTKTGQAQLRTYQVPSGKTRTRPSTIISRLQQRRHDQQQQRQKLKQLVLH
jgi:hypothetical protein